MKTFFKNIFSGLIIGFTAFSVIYASLNSVNPGDTLTSDKWNELIGTMNTFSGALDGGLASPTGAVMAFYRETCPSGWLRADGIESPLDLRGSFIRGLGGDENGKDEVRGLGNYQDDTFQGHQHGAGLMDPAYGATKHGGGIQAYIANPSGVSGGANSKIYNALLDVGNGTPRISSETRPKNVALIYCVKE